MTEAERNAEIQGIQARLSAARLSIADATGRLQEIHRDLIAAAEIIGAAFRDRQVLESAQLPSGFSRTQGLLNNLRRATREREEFQRLLLELQG